MARFTKLEGVAKQAYDRMCNTLMQTAKTELGLSEKDLILRQLRPEDLGLTGAWTVNLTAIGWVTYINAASVANNRFLGIYGIAVPQTAVQAGTQVRITAQGQVLRWWGIQDASMTEDNTFYFDDPVEVIKQNTPVTVEVYARAINATERCVLLGAVVEKEGILVRKGV